MIYKFEDNQVGFNTWQRHVEHHMQTIYGISTREAGVDRCDLHNVHYRDHRTLGGSLEFVRTWGEKYGLEPISEPCLPPALPDEAKAQGLYLKLFHGRTFIDQDLDDWGCDGPVLGPMNYVHCTYMCEVKYAVADGVAIYGLEEESRFSVMEDLLEVDGVYYGDWSVFYHEGN